MFAQFFVAQSGTSGLSASDWITAGAIAATAIAVSILIRRLTKRRLRKIDTNAEIIDALGRLAIIVVLLLGAFYTLQALDIQVGPLLGTLGVGVVFLAVGLQPLLVHVVGSFVLQARRPFRRGDQIKVLEIEGTVLDITSTSTVVLTYNGEVVHVPNAALFANPLLNRTHEPYRRSVMKVSVPYGTELPLVLRNIGRGVRTALADDSLPPAEALATGYGDHGVFVEVRYWHYSEQLEADVARSQVTVAVEKAITDMGLEIPYPQVVIHPAPPSAVDDPPDDAGTG